MKYKNPSKLLSVILALCTVFCFTADGFTVTANVTENRWNKLMLAKSGSGYCLIDDSLATLQNSPSLPIAVDSSGNCTVTTNQNATDWAIPLRIVMESCLGYSVVYNPDSGQITINGTIVVPVVINGINYISLGECRKVCGLDAEVRTIENDVYLIFYTFAGENHGALANDEFLAQAYHLNSYDIDKFYVSYNGQRENTYTKSAINDSGNIAGKYKHLSDWKNQTSLDYTALLGSFNDNIPVIDISKNNSPQDKPIVIIQHGMTGSMLQYMSLIGRLADEGYRVIAIDAYCHGERQSNTQAVPISTIQIAERLTVDWDTVINYYKERSSVNTKQFAMIGFSMGGMATYNQLAFGLYKPSVVIPMMGTPDWESMLDISSDNNADFPSARYVREKRPGGGFELQSAVNSIMLFNNTSGKSLSPEDQLMNLTDWDNTAILALNSGNDPIVPTIGSSNLVSTLKQTTNHKYFDENCGHWTSPSMSVKVINFIKAHLPVNRKFVDITLKLDCDTYVSLGEVYTVRGSGPQLFMNNEIILPIRSPVTSSLGYWVEYNYTTENVELTDDAGITTVIPNSEISWCEGKSYLTLSKYSSYMNSQCKMLVQNGKVYVVIYKDSYEFAVLNNTKTAEFIKGYRDLAED